MDSNKNAITKSNYQIRKINYEKLLLIWSIVSFVWVAWFGLNFCVCQVQQQKPKNDKSN
jgi:uncharacterized membrane protein